MCVKGTKEHEAILATDAPPRKIHAAPAAHRRRRRSSGPVRAQVRAAGRDRRSPSSCAWHQDGRLQKSDAREWVWDEKAKKPLDIDWVFAGSVLYEDPITKKPRYAADEGDLITVANFASAILDLPIASSANDADRMFTANTAKIPPLGTEVFVVWVHAPSEPGAKAPLRSEGHERSE